MKIDVVTIFPNFFNEFLTTSIIKRAISDNKVSINIHDLRDYSTNKHRKVDDTPYGGGAGMVFMCEPVFNIIDKLRTDDSTIVMLTPSGKTFNNSLAYEMSSYKHIIFLCGHYEGFDARINTLVDIELSIGDFVLTGGEIPSMCVIDSIVRLIDGVIKEDSHINDSFNDNLLDYDNYTKPSEFRDLKVPDVLLSGDHAKIKEWRHLNRIKNTKEKRPDLLKRGDFN